MVSTEETRGGLDGDDDDDDDEEEDARMISSLLSYKEWDKRVNT